MKKIVREYLDEFTLSSVVFKVTNRCNLKCSYCYWFKDGSALKKPPFMPINTAREFLNKLENYILLKQLKHFSIGLHGGEPLLWPYPIASVFFAEVRELEARTGCKVRTSIQTNGTLIDKRWLDLIVKNNVSIGVSIDGSKELHDQYRVDFKGNGSWDRVWQFINELRLRDVEFGVLSVANLESNPKDLLQYFVEEMRITSFDILVPDKTRDDPHCVGKYAEYFKCLHKEWKSKYVGKVEIRTIKNFISAILNLGATSEEIGLGPSNLFVVDTDGLYAQHDVLKICNDFNFGIDSTVFNTEICDLVNNEKFSNYLLDWITFSKKCQTCPELTVCGGGYLPHRWSSKNKSFQNPSIYCDDLIDIISYMRKDLDPYTHQFQPLMGATAQ